MIDGGGMLDFRWIPRWKGLSHNLVLVFRIFVFVYYYDEWRENITQTFHTHPFPMSFACGLCADNFCSFGSVDQRI